LYRSFLAYHKHVGDNPHMTPVEYPLGKSLEGPYGEDGTPSSQPESSVLCGADGIPCTQEHVYAVYDDK
jgi:hypothetical protein